MPPKKGRSKSPKLSEKAIEAKKDRLAAKRAVKLQRDRDILYKTQQDQLYREINYGRACVKRHEKQWRAMLLTIAEPRMRMEVECAMHHFERAIDAKDFEVSFLMDELKAAEEQYARSVRSHIDDIDRIIVLCYDQIAELWDESANMISNLYRAANTERSDVMRIDLEHEIYLKTMLFGLTENSRKIGKLMRGDYLSRQEVEISRLNDIATKYKDDWRIYFHKLWTDAQDFMSKYKNDFSRKKKFFEEFNKADDEMQVILRTLWDDCHEAYETIKKLKLEQVLFESAQNKQIKDLTDEKDHYENESKRVKKRLSDDLKIDNDNLKVLSLKCNDILQYLEKFATRGEKLLSLGGICRKFETMKEKTLRYPSFKEFIPEKKHKVVDMMESYANVSEGVARINNILLRRSEMRERRESREIEDPCAINSEVLLDDEEQFVPQMELFWMRLGALESNRVKLLEECSLVRVENEQLKRQLFDYCQCLNCEHDLVCLYHNPHFLT